MSDRASLEPKTHLVVEMSLSNLGFTKHTYTHTVHICSILTNLNDKQVIKVNTANHSFHGRIVELSIIYSSTVQDLANFMQWRSFKQDKKSFFSYTKLTFRRHINSTIAFASIHRLFTSVLSSV